MAKKTYWAQGIVLSIVFCICACVATIVIALQNPVQLDNSYFENSQKVNSDINEILASKRAFEAKFSPSLQQTNFTRAGGELLIHLNAKEPILSPLDFKLLLTRPDSNAYNMDLNATWDNQTLRTRPVKFPLTGRWQLMAKFTDANTSGFYKFEFFVSDE